MKPLSKNARRIEEILYRTLSIGLVMYQIFVIIIYFFPQINNDYGYHLGIIQFRIHPIIEYNINGICLFFLMLNNIRNLKKNRKINTYENQDTLKVLSFSYSVGFLTLCTKHELFLEYFFSNIFLINFYLEIFMVALFPIFRETIRFIIDRIHKKSAKTKKMVELKPVLDIV